MWFLLTKAIFKCANYFGPTLSKLNNYTTHRLTERTEPGSVLLAQIPGLRGEMYLYESIHQENHFTTENIRMLLEFKQF